MTTHLTIHLAVNNEYGVHTGHCEGIDIYGGDIFPLMALRGSEIACGVHQDDNGHNLLQIGDCIMQAFNYREFAGNLIWDACRISLADAAHVINAVREHGWDCEEGESELYALYAAGQEIGEKDLGRAMGVGAR